MSPRPLQPCGTWAAYKRHLKASEEPCEPCRVASAVRSRDRYRSWPEWRREKHREAMRKWRSDQRDMAAVGPSDEEN